MIFIGIQGSGKSTFYERRFAGTHLRISRDIAGTAARERRLFEACLARKIDFVVDNTNLTRGSREPFITAGRAAGYRVIGYFFVADVKDALARQRIGIARVPVPAIFRARKVMEPPSSSEGFDELYEVRIEREEIICLRMSEKLG